MTMEEVLVAARKQDSAVTVEQLEEGMQAMSALLPGPPPFIPNLHALSAKEWAKVLLDAPEVGNRLLRLKVHYPNLDLSVVVARRPYLLLSSVEAIDKDAEAVSQMLATAEDADKLLAAVPELLSARFLMSALVSINKWYRCERDPVEVLESDPELIYRAQAMDQAFEPVYENADGSFQAPQFNYKEKRTDWQKHIDDTRFNGAPGPAI